MKDIIAEARELCEKATPGPWKYEQSIGGKYAISTPDFGIRDYCFLTVGLERETDAAFIASSRTLIPELCDALEKANGEIERLKKRLAYQDDGINPEVAEEFSKHAVDIISKLDAIIKGLPEEQPKGE